MTGTFQRVQRYITVKLVDLEAAEIPPMEAAVFDLVLNEVVAARRRRGKPDLNCVVVESDWPEFEPTWAAIERRMQACQMSEPIKLTPYNPSVEMREAMKRIDPALTHEQCRALWASAWSAAPTAQAAPQPQPAPPSVLQHVAVAEGGELRWMTGRRILNCELYTLPIPTPDTGSDQEALAVAEMVGLIGPRSRVGDSHAAVARFAKALRSPKPAPGTSIPASGPSTYVQRFAEAVRLLTHASPPAEMVAAWLDKSSEDLQGWVGAQAGTPEWVQNLAITDAAHALAVSPVEGEQHDAQPSKFGSPELQATIVAHATQPRQGHPDDGGVFALLDGARTVREAWMASFDVTVRRDKHDIMDFVITKVAAREFQLYPNEAAYLRDLLVAAEIPGYPRAPTGSSND